MSSAIDIADVHKVYRGRVAALRGVSLTVRRGEIFGLLGPNGAGKSTLIKILMTIVRPTRCTGTVLDRPVGEKATLARIGYLPENHRFPRYLTGRQTIEFFGALASTPRRERKSRASQLIDRVGMTGWADRKVSAYSKGMMQRIGLAQALVNDPDLVLLDEPTDGVDPVGRRDIRQVIRELRDAGKTIFINSHLLSELEAVSDRVAIMVRGQVARQGTHDELAASQRRYEIELGSSPSAEIIEALQTQLQIAVTISERTLSLATIDPQIVQPAIDLLRARGGIIHAVRPVRSSLEDLFIEAVGDRHEVGAFPVV